VLRTRVGYAGGAKDKPTYRAIGDHTEALQVEFDPKRITFEDLLEVFFAEHDPFQRAWSTQYKAVLWTHGKEQEAVAKKALAALAKEEGREPTTELRPAPTFWIAEDYHQKYYLRSRTALFEALLGPKPDGKTVRESTVTARVNGWIGGYGTTEQIAAQVEALKLSEKAREALARELGSRAPVACK
jgi:methionine-S-sulfoxide reductase